MPFSAATMGLPHVSMRRSWSSTLTVFAKKSAASNVCGGEALDLLEIATGHERPLLARGEHHAAHAGVGDRSFDGGIELGKRGGVDHVGGAILLVPGEDGDAFFDLVVDDAHGTLTLVSMMVAVPMPGPHAEGDERGALVPALELVEHRAEQHAARCAQRMAHGDGPAVDVGVGGVDTHLLHEEEAHRSKRFVDLEKIDVRRLHLRALERLLRRRWKGR